MKSTERHKLKENEFARSMAQARIVVEQRRGDVTRSPSPSSRCCRLSAGHAWRRSVREAGANQALAAALAVYEMPVVPIPPPAPGSPPPVPQPGTFPTEQDKLTASLPVPRRGQRAPNTPAGIAARFHAAAILAAQGKPADAEQRYKEVIDKAGNASIYSRTAKLGMARPRSRRGR